MRFLALLFLVACVAEDDPWLDADDPDVAAELENPPGDDAMVDLVDDTADLGELDGDAAPGDDDGEDVVAAAATFRNPVGPTCADPGVVKVTEGGVTMFYAACTGKGFPLWKSTDLVTWKRAGSIFSAATKPAWANGNWWAPEIHRVGDGLVAYFTALSPSRNKMCIGAARATTMAGPWRDIGRPLVCDSHVSLIDATVYSAANGKRYLYYKTDGNGLRPQEKTIIYGHELRADGVGFVGTRRALLKNTLSWEGDVVEAPWVIKRGSYYYLFYSGFRYCDDTYGVGIARSKSPLGPFTKRTKPILASNSAWSGPGHNSIVRTGGRAWMVYHAWRGAHSCGDDGPGRVLMLDPITWSGGWPHVGNGTPTRTSQPRP